MRCTSTPTRGARGGTPRAMAVADIEKFNSGVLPALEPARWRLNGRGVAAAAPTDAHFAHDRPRVHRVRRSTALTACSARSLRDAVGLTTRRPSSWPRSASAVRRFAAPAASRRTGSARPRSSRWARTALRGFTDRQIHCAANSPTTDSGRHDPGRRHRVHPVHARARAAALSAARAPGTACPAAPRPRRYRARAIGWTSPWPGPHSGPEGGPCSRLHPRWTARRDAQPARPSRGSSRRRCPSLLAGTAPRGRPRARPFTFAGISTPGGCLPCRSSRARRR